MKLKEDWGILVSRLEYSFNPSMICALVFYGSCTIFINVYYVAVHTQDVHKNNACRVVKNVITPLLITQSVYKM